VAPVATVQRIWRTHQLRPHRLRTFKRSRDPGFAAKLADIVGLYVDPSAMLWCSRLTKRARFKRSAAPNPDRRSSLGAARP
jgi:hypothetical protein